MPSTGIAVSLPRRLSPSLNEPKPSLFRRPELQQSHSVQRSRLCISRGLAPAACRRQCGTDSRSSGWL